MLISAIAVVFWAHATGHAQMSILPEQCAAKTGNELDRCVRDLALPQIVPKLEFVEPVRDPAQLLNCTKVHAPDQVYCVARNEIILECRRSLKHADFDACFTGYMAQVAKPGRANCQLEKPGLRAACASRNAVFAKCLADPLRYFQCLSGTGRG